MKECRSALFKVICITSCLIFSGCQKPEKSIICYNCTAGWGGWREIFATFKQRTEITVPSDSRNTGQTLAAGVSEKQHPLADVYYLGGQGGIQAEHLGLTQEYRPQGFDKIPENLRDPNGHWFAVHTGTIGFFVNTAALDGRPIPTSWASLLNPMYRGMIAYFNPKSAAAGFVTGMAVNFAFGGSYTDLSPGINFLKNLQNNKPLVIRQTAYARVLSGEIPIMIDYDFNAYRARYRDHAHVMFVIPEEGSVSFPYVMALVAHDPHPDDAKKFLDYLISAEGQALWAKAYMRPAISGHIPAEIAKCFLPEKEYARVHSLNLQALSQAQSEFSRLYSLNVGQ